MYDGSRFHGWQIQPNSLTVQERLNVAVSTVLAQDVNVVGAGRTDSGVHAKQMFAHFDTPKTIERADFIHKLNSFLENDISVINLRKVKSDAHCRFDAISRTYEYHIFFKKNPFLHKRAWFVPYNLDIRSMTEASDCLRNYSDFTSFSKLHTQTKTNLCNIINVEWREMEDSLVFVIEANRFLRNMVRAIVGSLVDIGLSKNTIAGFCQIIENKNRALAGVSAPAHGLYLSSVKYPKTIWNE